MSSQKNGDKAASSASSSGIHSLRKRHSPNNPTATGTSSSSANPQPSNVENAASFSKVRKVSTAASKSDQNQQQESTSKAITKPTGEDPNSIQNVRKRPPGSRELSSLIQPFPNRTVVSEERLTRSKAKALEQNVANTNTKVETVQTAKKSASNTKTASATAAKSSDRDNPGSSNETTRASNFFNTLVPRMQHLLNAATGGSGSPAGGTRNVSEAIAETGTHFQHYIGSHHHAHATTPAMLSLVEGLRSSNEIRQSEAASELAEMLLLGNEESLPNMPIVEIVQALCALLQKDNNYDLMLTAARCITNMQEALPRALPVIAEAIPLLLSKLKRIEYIDVAEQSLIALDVMSKRNGKQILHQGGIASTISHVDFFSLPSQRLCYRICANCAAYVTQNEFHWVKDCLPDLTQRLVYVDDRQCVESICQFFNRIIENLRQHPDHLNQIVGPSHEFLQNAQKLLAIQPSNISSNTYLSLLKSLRYISKECPDAALALVRMDFANTIRVLIGPERNETAASYSSASVTGDATERGLSMAMSRPAIQLKEIMSLIRQLAEKIPRDCPEVLSLLKLFPLLVEIGSNSSCTQLRNESMNAMCSMIKMANKLDQLEPILSDIPLAVYITQMLSSNRNLGVLLSTLQLSRALLDKLPQLYIPLFEAEGVFHEAARLTTPIDSPTIDKKPPQHPTRAAMAEQLLEGLVNSTHGGSSAVRVIIPSILLGHDNGNNGNGQQAHQQNVQIQQDLVCKEAKEIADNYTGERAYKRHKVKEPHRAKKLFDQLTDMASMLRSEKDHRGGFLMKKLKELLMDPEQEITSFQINQSDIPTALIAYLTADSEHATSTREARLKHFASVFMGLDGNDLNVDSIGAIERHQPFEKLIKKILQTIDTVEQFQVRTTNLSGIITGGSFSGTMTPFHSALLSGSGTNATLFSTTLRGANALRFFQTHQIRINLRRHPKCKNLREWRHGRGSIKVDPFTSVSSIERYLLERGIAVPSTGAQGQQQQQSDDGDDDSEISDEDQDMSFSSALSNDGRIELYIGDQRLPNDMSILQAIRQYALPNENDDDGMETIPSSIWLTAHTIFYSNPSNETANDAASTSASNTPAPNTTKNVPVVATEESQPTSSIRSRTRLDAKRKGEASSSTGHATTTVNAKESPIYKTGKIPTRQSSLEAYLHANTITQIKDPALNCLHLLKVLYGLNNYWWELFDDNSQKQSRPIWHKALIPQSTFFSAKLNSKVSRQLSDFLTVATQQIPGWALDLMNNFPFAFSFATRRSFIFCTSFGRDRALMHLVSESNNDDGQEGAGHDASSRLIPRLERRKVAIKRENLLEEAQQIFAKMGASKAMLEVGFEGEVGTGFGPTLEFYSTLGRALQKHSLDLWDGSVRKCPKAERDGSGDDDFTYAPNGLYPKMLPYSLTPKQNDVRLKRFEFIGRLLAQSLLDSRMLDLPLAPAFFKWLTDEEETLGMDDFEKLHPDIARSLAQTSEEDYDKLLDWTFTHPCESSIELVKGGNNTKVTSANCKQFLELVCYWRLVEGVRAQMEAVRRGFQMVINKECLRIFSSDEMELLFCGSADNDEKIWSKSALHHAIRPDHGYTHESPQIKWLIEMLCAYPKEKRRRFLQFVTGSPRLPIGGFAGLNPPLKVVKKTACTINNQDELPSAMTCYNYLKIPPYESSETFLARFDVALEHVYSFYLT